MTGLCGSTMGLAVAYDVMYVSSCVEDRRCMVQATPQILANSCVYTRVKEPKID